MFYFLNPPGLLALTSLGGVLFLYFYVFRGRRREVSSLFLWEATRTLKAEGQRRKLPPLTLPLLLELLAALLLALLVSELVLDHRSSRRHIVVVLDSSASMNAESKKPGFKSAAVGAILKIYDELGANGRVTILNSATSHVIGEQAMGREDAEEALRTWRPSAPPHSFRQAVEVGHSMAGKDTDVLVITDHEVECENARVVAVGRAESNAGWINARWLGNDKLFGLVKHSGKGGGTRTIAVYDQTGQKIAEKTVTFGSQKAVPLLFHIPERVRTIRAELPDDTLENDNVLHLVRPLKVTVPCRIDLSDERLAENVKKAVHAARHLSLAGKNTPYLVFGDFRGSGGDWEHFFRVSFRAPAERSSQAYVGPFFAKNYHPLTRGLNLRGSIWFADSKYRPDRGEVVVSAGQIPLVVMEDLHVVLNLGGPGSNIFQKAAWPVLISNIGDYVYRQSPGLKRYCYRLGERLAFYKPASWRGNVIIEAPNGERVTFSDKHVYYGKLDQEGIYTIHGRNRQGENREMAAVGVNLLSEAESDLSNAKHFGSVTSARASVLKEKGVHNFHREFSLGIIVLLISCWFLLEKRA
ncbi:MAG: hypothetical protein ACLFWL_14060 [Candidatus Brocadiia bacterium]